MLNAVDSMNLESKPQDALNAEDRIQLATGTTKSFQEIRKQYHPREGLQLCGGNYDKWEGNPNKTDGNDIVSIIAEMKMFH